MFQGNIMYDCSKFFKLFVQTDQPDFEQTDVTKQSIKQEIINVKCKTY